MSKLYGYCQLVQRHIEGAGLDVFKTRGEIALQCGFLISLVGPGDSDDPAKVEALREAVRELLGIDLD